jgi:hypothetical protein
VRPASADGTTVFDDTGREFTSEADRATVGDAATRIERRLARIEREDEERAEEAHLPGEEELDEREARGVVDRFLTIRDQQAGRRAASADVLADPPDRVATALLTVAAAVSDPRPLVEAFVDLQSFRPDADVGLLTLSTASRKDREGAEERLSGARAAATAFLRDDITIIGNQLALDSDLVIGDGRRALEAVELRRSAQAAGFASIYLWPIGAIAGAVVAVFIVGLSIVALAGAAVVALAALFAGPAYGWAVGTMAARANNAFMRLPSPRLAYLGRSVSEIAGMVLLVAGPAALSIVIAIAAKSLGFP